MYSAESLENLYDISCPPVKAARGVDGYRLKTIAAGQMVECEIYPLWSTRPKTRRAKTSVSCEAQARLNNVNSIKRLTRLINANFNENDIWLTLTYNSHSLPDSIESAQRDTANYIRRLRRAAERAGYPALKYIIVTETHESDNTPVRIHHHMIINFSDRDTAESLWHAGRTQARRLQPDEFGFEGLARYLSKHKSSNNRRVSKRWRSSNHLIQPKVTINDRRVKRSHMNSIARSSEAERRDYFERLYPGCIYLDCRVRFSDYVPGAYLYVRMRRTAPPPSGLKRLTSRLIS